MNANNTPDFTQNQRHVKKDVGEKLTDEEAENMIKVTEVDNAQWIKQTEIPQIRFS